jgi:hypothetical protein
MAKKKILTGMLALVLVFGMIVVGCDNGSTGSAGYSPPVVDVQGKFDYSGQSVEFIAGSDTARSVRAAATDGYSITGKLQYMGSVLTVVGTYIPSEKVFRGSALSNNISFEIEGELTDDYRLKNAKVRIVTKSAGGTWNQNSAATANVTPATDISIPGDAEPFPTEGVVPVEFRGKWIFKEMEDRIKQEIETEAAENGGSAKVWATSFVIITPMGIQQKVWWKVTATYMGETYEYEEDRDRTLNLVSVTKTDGITTVSVQFESGLPVPYTMEISGNTLTMVSTYETVHFVR